MPTPVIVDAARTAYGKRGGALSSLHAVDLLGRAQRGVLDRLDLDPDVVDEVIGGCVTQAGEQSNNVSRFAWLHAGLPETTGATTIDAQCGSAQQAVHLIAAQIAGGLIDVGLACGVESMSQVEHYALLRLGVRGDVGLQDRLARARVTAGGVRHPVPGGMIETAENLRREFSISREDQDALALRSQQQYAAGLAAGNFVDELVPVEVKGRKGTTVVDADEHPRPDTTLEALAALRPIMGRSDPEATVTAGNASGQNDAAALCIVTTRAEAERRGLDPLLTLRSWAVAGCGPEVMGIGPVPASDEALSRAGLSMADIDLIELNEAFAAQALAVTRQWQLTESDWERVNVNGSGISMGHPVGATGARILATMAYEMRRRDSRYGLETMCIGGGQGLAAVFEAA